MKKLILSVFMVVVFSTPCIAQLEIGDIFPIDNNIYSIENTLWQRSDDSDYQIGFAGGKIYCGSNEAIGIYFDLQFLSIFALQCEGIVSGFLLPLLAMGQAYPIYIGLEGLTWGEPWYLVKVESNWLPPGD